MGRERGISWIFNSKRVERVEQVVEECCSKERSFRCTHTPLYCIVKGLSYTSLHTCFNIIELLLKLFITNYKLTVLDVSWVKL